MGPSDLCLGSSIRHNGGGGIARPRDAYPSEPAHAAPTIGALSGFTIFDALTSKFDDFAILKTRPRCVAEWLLPHHV
jgi:hypothetical protein